MKVHKVKLDRANVNTVD